MSTDTPRPDTILVSRGPGETRYALLAEEIVIEVVHVRDVEAQPGAHYLGRIGKAAPGTGGVFVDLDIGLPGLLQTKVKLPGEGRNVTVCVSAPARADKGPKLKLVEAYGPEGDARLLESAPDATVEWIERYANSLHTIIVNRPIDAARLRKQSGKDIDISHAPSGTNLFQTHGVDDAIDMALQTDISLPGGGSLRIETTAAATTIDVNAGSGTATQANHAALIEIARQLRLRNISGHVLIDIIPTKQRANLPGLLRAALAADPLEPEVAGLTPLGMIELTRRRFRNSLADILGTPSQPTAAGLAYKVMRDAVGEALRTGLPHLRLRLPRPVENLLNGELAGALAEAKATTGGKIELTVSPDPVTAKIEIESYS